MVRTVSYVLLATLIAVLFLEQSYGPLAYAFCAETPESHNRSALAYFRDGKSAEALSAIRRATASEPGNAAYQFNLAFLYGNDPETAMRVFNKDRQHIYREVIRASRNARSLQPRDVQIAESHAMNFLSADRFGAASDTKEKREAWEYYLELRESMYAEKPSGGNKYARVSALLNLASLAIEQNRTQEASSYLDRVETFFPASPRVEYLRALIEENEGNPRMSA